MICIFVNCSLHIVFQWHIRQHTVISWPVIFNWKVLVQVDQWMKTGPVSIFCNNPKFYPLQTWFLWTSWTYAFVFLYVNGWKIALQNRSEVLWMPSTFCCSFPVHLLAIGKSSSEKCLFRSFTHFWKLGLLWLLTCISFLYICLLYTSDAADDTCVV